MMTRRTARITFGLLVLGLTATACAGGMTAGTMAPTEALDRTTMPEPGPPPTVNFPDVQRFTLSNGLPVSVVERRGVPLVTMQMLFEAGGVTDPLDKPGLSSLTAAMLTEGTTTRSSTQIAEETDLLAASVNAGIGRETAVVTLSTLSRALEPALDIFADVIVNPAFNDADWQRVQQQRFVSLLQTIDQPAALAGQEFNHLVFGEGHPYGRPLQGTPESVGAITTADLHGFHDRFYVPNNANLIVVGDVDATRLRAQLERVFGTWRSSGALTPVNEAPPAATPTTIYLIDKPGAAQSEIRIGHAGVDRMSPDYFAILVMNALLGGDFGSRINMNLREDKGYTYGAGTGFTMARMAGPFTASAAVQTGSTRESVIEFMKELEEIRSTRPATEAEVAKTRTGLIRQEPLRLETNVQIAGRIADLIRYGLPEDYFEHYTERLAAVTTADVNRVAREQIKPDKMSIVIVGDRSVVEEGLRTLPYPLEIVDIPPPQIPTP